MGAYHLYMRDEIGLAVPKAPLAPYGYVDGIIVHYVGSERPLPLNPTLEQSKALMRSLQADAFARTSEHYIDFEYNHAVDPVGRIFEGRGWAHKNGANGSANYNGHALAVVYLIGVDQPITLAARDALVWYCQEAVRRWHMVSYVKPHSAVAPRGTECPSDAVRAFIPELQARLHEDTTPPAPVSIPSVSLEDVEEMIIMAPARQQKSPTRPAYAWLDRAGKKIWLEGSARLKQVAWPTDSGESAVPIPTISPVIGWTVSADGERIWVTAQKFDKSGSPAFGFDWA